MQEFKFKQGEQSVKIRFKLYDASITTEPKGLTGLTNASPGLTISTIHENEASAVVYTGANIETIGTLGTYVNPSVGKCRFKEVDATNHPGVYELQLINTRFNDVAIATSKEMLITLSGATSLIQTDIKLKLVKDDPFTAKPANFDLIVIDGSGRLDISKLGGTTLTARDIGASVLISPGTGTGQLDVTSGAINITQAGANRAWTSVGLGGAAKTLTDVTNIVSNGAITTLAGAVVNVDTVDTVGAISSVTTVGTVTNPVTLDASATSAALVSDIVDGIEASTVLADILADTGELQSVFTTGGSLDSLLNSIYLAIDTEVQAIKAKTDQLTFTSGKVDAGIQAAGDITAAVCNKVADHILRRSLAAALASSNGDTKAFKSMLGGIAKLVNKVDIDSGTMTTYETDGTTVLGTQTVTSSPAADPITGLGN